MVIVGELNQLARFLGLIRPIVNSLNDGEVVDVHILLERLGDKSYIDKPRMEGLVWNVLNGHLYVLSRYFVHVGDNKFQVHVAKPRKKLV